MRVLVACEYSGRVRQAFQKQGHEAYSCDLLDSEDGSPWHIKANVLTVIDGLGWPDQVCGGHRRGDWQSHLDTPFWPDLHWDLMVAHPPCTHLSVSGARWFKDKRQEQSEALEFVRKLMDAPIQRIAIENPISIISSRIRKPDQIIQPWQFGHGETKATCLWLKNLPKLKPTNIVEGREARVHRMPPGPDRWKERSRTYQGIADAMADQWGNL